MYFFFLASEGCKFVKKNPQDGPMDLCRICLDSVCASRSRGTSRAFAFGVSQKLLGVVGSQLFS